MFRYCSCWRKLRVLLASIKYLAQCPCPRCLVKKDQIGDLGTKFDSQWHDQIWEDNSNRKGNIEMTRSWIFEKGRGILSAAVERVLSPMSLVPTRVRLYSSFFIKVSSFRRMPSLPPSPNSASISTRCLLWISFTNSNLEYGKQCSPT